MANGRKTGGRQKGTPNKSTSIREAEIAAGGITPMEYFMRILRGGPPDLPPDAPESDRKLMIQMWDEGRAAAAKELMPYCHPRLASTEAHTTVDTNIFDEVAAEEAKGTKL